MQLFRNSKNILFIVGLELYELHYYFDTITENLNTIALFFLENKFTILCLGGHFFYYQFEHYRFLQIKIIQYIQTKIVK